MLIKTPAEKLRIRAVLLCKEPTFWKFLSQLWNELVKSEESATHFIYDWCNIKSRSEIATNHYAQIRLMALDKKYLEYLNPVDDIYADNLNRY